MYNKVKNIYVIKNCIYYGIVYTHGLTDLCTYALRIMGSHYF